MGFTITTKSRLYVRKGPGMIYESTSIIDKGKTLTSTEVKKDANDTSWYKIDNGWICGEYVTLSKDAVKKSVLETNKPSKKIKSVISEAGSTIISEISQGSGIGTVANPNSGLGSIFGGGTGGQVNTTDILLGQRIYGVPYQFLPSTDFRGTENRPDKELGLSFMHMMSELPILSVIPGRPSFLPDFDEEQKNSFLRAVTDQISQIKDRIPGVGESDQLGGEVRYFMFKPSYVEYIRYVNTLCQVCAIFMGIGDEYVPGYEGGDDKFTFGKYDWSRYTLANQMAGRPTNNALFTTGDMGLGEYALETVKDVKESIGQFMESLWGMDDQDKDAKAEQEDENGDSIIHGINNNAKYYTEFVINPSIGYSESLGNTTKQSMLAGIAGQASEMSKEIGFLLSSSVIGRDTFASATNTLNNDLNKVMSGNESSIMNRFLKSTTTILSGSNIIFPDIWQSSDFNRSYTIEIDLKTPYGDRKSVFLNLMVPMWHWVALTAPRQTGVNAYGAPFLVRCFVPGIFDMDMGIVRTLTIQKGGDGTAWSVEGFPLEIKLSIDIQDLYKSLSISRINGLGLDDVRNFLWNTGLINHLAVQSGLDMKTSEWATKIKMVSALAQNALGDLFQHPKESIMEAMSQALRAGWVGSR